MDVGALERHESHLVRYAMWDLGDIERAREVVQERSAALQERSRPSRDHLANGYSPYVETWHSMFERKENRMSPLSDASGCAPSEHLDCGL